MITIDTLDGKSFASMFISGANNLYNKRKQVDDLNVFPVPDGDTGTNMSLTVKAMTAELTENQSLSLTKTADLMSFSTLRGARGNSGVILSQFFRGISKNFKGKEACNASELASALSDGAAAAYKAVMKPTEGTILTVAREAAAGAAQSAADGGDIAAVVAAALERGNDALSHTPEQLPALKQAGVVDAGGQGWIYVLEGALEYLRTGAVIENESASAEEKPSAKRAQGKISTESIKFKYCTEFIIEKYERGQSADDLRGTISSKGDCMLVIDDDEIVKVHIHTNNPGFVLEEAVKLGELINIKIDNMKRQHRSLIANPADTPDSAKKPKTDTPKTRAKSEAKPKKTVEMKEFGFAAVASGRNIITILKDLGVDKVIEGGQSMNPSTDDILKAVNRVKAKRVFVFPNNKNIIMAANQAASLSKNTEIIVMPSRNLPECISAMMAFNEAYDAETNGRAMLKAIDRVKAGQITYAVRDTEVEGTPIKKNDILGIAGGDIAVVGESRDDVLDALVERLTDEDTEFITVYYGKDVKKAEAEAAAARLEQKYAEDEIEVSVKRGGQPLYYYIVSAE